MFRKNVNLLNEGMNEQKNIFLHQLRGPANYRNSQFVPHRGPKANGSQRSKKNVTSLKFKQGLPSSSRQRNNCELVSTVLVRAKQKTISLFEWPLRWLVSSLLLYYVPSGNARSAPLFLCARTESQQSSHFLTRPLIGCWCHNVYLFLP